MSDDPIARSRLLSPNSTAAIVLGAHDWTEANLGRAPAFLRSARQVVAYLYDREGLGLDPELILDLFDDPAGAGDQLARIRDSLDTIVRDRRETDRPVSDVLVYYVGHGYTDDEGHLTLLVRRTRRGLETETGITAPALARTLRVAAPQQRRSIILDCCFSEAAAKGFVGMSSDLNQQVAASAVKDLGDDQPARGTLLLCSSPVGQISIGAPNAERTLFTGALLDVLRGGIDDRAEHLSFADLRDATFERMAGSFGANAPRPVLHQVNAAQGDLTRAPAFPNKYKKAEPRRHRLTPLLLNEKKPDGKVEQIGIPRSQDGSASDFVEIDELTAVITEINRLVQEGLRIQSLSDDAIAEPTMAWMHECDFYLNASNERLSLPWDGYFMNKVWPRDPTTSSFLERIDSTEARRTLGRTNSYLRSKLFSLERLKKK